MHTNGHLWINAPFMKLHEFITHYNDCKAISSSNLTTCILVPGYLLPVLKPLLANMHLLKRFSKGTTMFDAPTANGQRRPMPGVHWPIYVYTDSMQSVAVPAKLGAARHKLHAATVVQHFKRSNVAQYSDKSLSMLFEGKSAGLTVQTLLDSGANANFISPRVVQRLNIPVQPVADAKLILADNSESAIKGFVKMRLRLGPFHTTVACYVTELSEPFDVILGSSFLSEHLAVMLFETGTCTLKRGHKQYTLHYASNAVNASENTEDSDVSKLVMSVAQAKRCIKADSKSFMVMVSTVDQTDSDAKHTMNPELAQQITALQQQYNTVFAEPSGLPPDRGIEHVIPLLPDSQPPFQRMYRLSPSELQEVRRNVTELLRKDLIEPSVSSFGAPILFVEKKDKTLRMVIDYRALNKLTVKNRYPLPRIDDLFDQLHGAKYFTSLDAASGFHQIRLREEDRPKTAFRTPFGHYQFKVLPFGLTNALATFQGVMNRLFNPPQLSAAGDGNSETHLSNFVTVFIDDILVFSKTAEEHVEHLKTVLNILREQEIYLKPSKCVWGQTELAYLGHIVSEHGLKPDPKKVQTVQEWPQPTTVTEIQQFLGLTNFFRKYIQGYAKICSPMTNLTRKQVLFHWTEECNKAFLQLKRALTSAPVLALPDPKLPYELVCDASSFGIGAVLLQEGRPISF